MNNSRSCCWLLQGKRRRGGAFQKVKSLLSFSEEIFCLRNMPSRYTENFVPVLYANKRAKKRHIKLRKINLWISPRENHLSDT
jgi:hypothetical protein